MKPRILFMGTPAFAVPALQVLLDQKFPVASVVCQPDRPQGRHMQLAAPPVKQLALHFGLSVLQPEKVRAPDFEAAVQSLAPDLIVTAAYGRILPPQILKIPLRGCLNIHASLLPAYRGASPVQACLIHGERETGVTFMLMDEGMDTGDILHQVRHPVSDTVDAGLLTSQLADLGARELPAVIEGWMECRLVPQPQDGTRASYAPVLNRDSGLIDWDADASTIHNLIRGTTPWPGAYTWCGHKRLKIHAARVCIDQDVLTSGQGLAPGTICRCGQEAISIVCSRGILDLLEVQAESGKRIQCRDCAHNYRLGQRMEASSDDS